ncbi:hypothetical protein BCR42DRAFT_450628 [Absidia repens]|uniref:Uncharacterized protein n=1 Tax=Absidia repens TaxID=90262 RepID=A0A1X2IKL3_9FUNG|nr:hypothetical protein BCR42DRAFT_450628 [Absidia repens]
MMTEDDLLQKILKLTNDLNIQQQINRDIAVGINSQVNEFKHRSIHNRDSQGSDIDTEDLLPELLPVNASNTTMNDNDDNSDALDDISSKRTKLLREHVYFKNRNQELEQECTDLQDLIHHYESSLELIAGKLRTCAAASSERQTQLRQEYEALLNAEKGTTVTLFMENVLLQSQLRKLSDILYNSYEENTTMVSHDTLIQRLIIENEGLRAMLTNLDQHSATPPMPSSLSYNQATETPNFQVAKPPNGVIQEYFEDDNSSSISISTSSIN